MLDKLSEFSGWDFFWKNFGYFRSNLSDKQLSHVQGGKDSIFPAAEGVAHTLGNVLKSLLFWPDFLIVLPNAVISGGGRSLQECGSSQ